MKIILIHLILLGILNMSSFAKEEDLENNLKLHVKTLAYSIGSRNVFTGESLDKAANYIKEQFQNYGYQIELQTYEVYGVASSNIIATKQEKSDEIIVVGAHYDSVLGSPGADDNASGVACLLELARLFTKENPQKTVRFIAFTNEEPPFFSTHQMGSEQYVRQIKKKKENIVVMLCLESIGYYSNKRNSQQYPFGFGLFRPDKGNFIAVAGNTHSRILVRKISRIFKAHMKLPFESVVTIPFLAPAIEFSDNASFWRAGYKAVMITDTAFYRNPHYHTANDTYDTLDYESLSELTQGLYQVLVELAR